MSVIVDFALERATKNTQRYVEVVDEGEVPVIGTLYVQKKAVAALGNPEFLRVTVEAQ